MSGKPNDRGAGACPFCGVATPVPHETQAGCIEALHSEIGRIRDILATLRPAGADPEDGAGHPPPATIRVSLD
jgi:hypothetical protein